MKASEFETESWNRIIPHISDLLKGNRMIFQIYETISEIPDDLSEDSEAIAQGFTKPLERDMPFEMEGRVVHSALRLIYPRVPSYEECLLIAKKWLPKDDLAGIKVGEKNALVGALKYCGSTSAVVIAVIDS